MLPRRKKRKGLYLRRDVLGLIKAKAEIGPMKAYLLEARPWQRNSL